jgi:hypothetical protein
LPLAPDLQYDAGLVDTFLHGRDRSFTIEGCCDLAAGAGLAFQDLFFKSPYYPADNLAENIRAAIGDMPEEKQWSIMERINHRNACHFFLACRADRPKAHYQARFDPESGAAQIPVFRFRCGFSGNEIYRPGWARPLSADELAVVSKIDGQRTLADIARITGRSETFDICERLWKQDFVAMGIKN